MNTESVNWWMANLLSQGKSMHCEALTNT